MSEMPMIKTYESRDALRDEVWKRWKAAEGFDGALPPREELRFDLAELTACAEQLGTVEFPNGDIITVWDTASDDWARGLENAALLTVCAGRGKALKRLTFAQKDSAHRELLRRFEAYTAFVENLEVIALDGGSGADVAQVVYAGLVETGTVTASELDAVAT